MEAREELIEKASTGLAYAFEVDTVDDEDRELIAAAVLDALLAHPELVIAALGGEVVAYADDKGPYAYGANAIPGPDDVPLYRFPVREGTDG